MTPRRPPHTLATLTLLAATACAGTTERDDTVPEGSLWVPPLKQSVFLRGVFDDDPSQSIGRFLAPRTPHAAIDESNTFASRCGKAGPDAGKTAGSDAYRKPVKGRIF